MANRDETQAGAAPGAPLLEVGPEGADELLDFESAGMQARIRVIGVGGAGGNALDTMIRAGLQGVEFICANTDAQALEHKLAPTKVQLGAALTRGLGCGANPEKGRAAALEDRDKLRDMLMGSDMVFVTAGLGGGTGTGAAPVVAEVAREIGALTVAVVSRPFDFEGRKRRRHAEHGLEVLQSAADTLIAIPNQQLVDLSGRDTTLPDAFKLADEVLLNAVKGISDVITEHGLVNVDFADVRTVMNEMGTALMGAGIGVGENRAKDAAHAAVSSPLLKDVSMDGARGVLINVTGGPDMTLWEVNEAATLVEQAAHEDANIIFGAVIDEQTPAGEVHVTVIATGLGAGQARRGARRETAYAPSQATAAAEAAETEQAGGAQAAVADEWGEAAEGAEAEPMRGAAQAPDAQSAEPNFESPFPEDEELDVPTFLRRGKVLGGAPQPGGRAAADEAEAPPLRRQSNG